MKTNKTTVASLKIPPLSRIMCPCCGTVGEYEVDNNLNTHCKKCGLIIDSPYPYCAGIKYKLLCDFIK